MEMKPVSEKQRCRALLKSLKGGEALQILWLLTENSASIRKAVIAEAEKLLKSVDTFKVAEEVYDSFNDITFEDFLKEANSYRHGYYRHETDVAYDLFQVEYDAHATEVEKLHQLGYHKDELSYVLGIILGLYRFEKEAITEFAEYVPDEPAEFAEILFSSWKKNCDQVSEMKDVYEFLEEHCPDWKF